MPQEKTNIIKLGKETTRGTAASSLSLHLPFVGSGLQPVIMNNVGKVMSSSTWPYVTELVPVGRTATLTLTPEFNVDTIRTLLTLATKRTAGDQPSITICHSRCGVGAGQFLGCVVSQLTMEYSRSGSPSDESVLQGSLSLECMQPLSGGTAVAGTQANAGRFVLGRGSVEVNSVAALEVLSYRRTISIAHSLGPPDASSKRLYLEDGEVEEQIELTARFSADAWTDLVLNATKHDVEIVHATGASDEEFTETLGAVQAEKHELGSADGTVTEQIILLPQHTGSAEPTIWDWGGAIGSDSLAL